MKKSIKLIDLLVKKNIGKKFKVVNHNFGGEEYEYIVREDCGVIELLDEKLEEITINNVTILFEFEEITQIENELKDSIKWVNENLNPHQQLIITLDGIKVVSDDWGIPNNK